MSTRAPIERVTASVLHSNRNPRAKGCGTLWAYGYSDLAAQLLITPAKLVELVTSGQLDPLSLVEVAAVRRRGLAWLRSHAEQLRRFHVEAKLESRVVVPSPLAPPAGLTTLWAWCYSDLAEASGKSLEALWSVGRSRRSAWQEHAGLGQALDFLDRQDGLWSELAAARSSAG